VRFEDIRGADRQSVDQHAARNPIWAMGILANGEYEAMGAWASRSDESSWAEVFEGFAARGVERIGIVAATESALWPALKKVFPDAIAVTDVATSLEAVPRRRRPAVRSGHDLLRAIQHEVGRIVRRRGVFDLKSETDPNAMKFLAQAVRVISLKSLSVSRR
jgi:transposase-like protein